MRMQVLDDSTAPIHLEIICPDDEGRQPSHDMTMSAVDMFMDMGPSYSTDHACRWENITKATIKASRLLFQRHLRR